MGGVADASAVDGDGQRTDKVGYKVVSFASTGGHDNWRTMLTNVKENRDQNTSQD